jgi:hypothetical protein
MRLADAAREVMGDHAPSVAWLRKQAAEGKLDIWRIAGKDYTTPDAIREMLDRCRSTRKESGYGSGPPTGTDRPLGSSETDRSRLALAALRERAKKLKSALPPTSQSATSQNGLAVVTPLRSR